MVLLIDANASLNDEAGIHCGGSEATKENVAGTALKELVAERALCIPQTFSKFGPTWHNRRLDFIAVPLNWHAAVSDVKVEPPEMLAINDFVDQRAVTLTVTLRQEKCQSRERLPNFERAAILTLEAKAQFESIWAQAPNTPAIWAPELIEQAMAMLAQETLQAVCPLGTEAPRQLRIHGQSSACFPSHDKRTGGASGSRRRQSSRRFSKFGGGCQIEATVWSLAGMGLQRRDLRQPGWANSCGRLRDRRVVLSGKIRLSGSREGRQESGRRRSQVPLVRSGISSDSSAVPRKRGDRNWWRSSQLRTGLLC